MNHFLRNIWMTDKRSDSFKLAVQQADGDACSVNEYRCVKRDPDTCFMRMVRKIGREFLTSEMDRRYYADHYTCCPPPLFIISVTLLELGFFAYYAIMAGEVTTTGPVPIDNIFIYRPDRRIELWRFIFYMVLHAGWIHLLFNLMVQLLVGLPLEMVHGSFRISIIYLAGVLAGSLGTSVFDRDVYLVGASGGVYALLAAHLANILLNYSEMELGIIRLIGILVIDILLNYSEMELGIIRLIGILVIASADVGFAIWGRYAAEENGPPVAYVAHLTGALAGLTIGLLVLKNFEQKLHDQIVWWASLGVYAACTVFAVLWNVFYI
ncbi:PREDICTED: protein rhomboid-like [Priapulus caudatus]|uniref:Protein rhomboid-like n=1 Tax=Priapulus caudatus TaxID=37621 RepID=A0ABM1FAH4_PRICU|nr:PREDICTED: protein rhomboid-like [Priapulus caudatus]